MKQKLISNIEYLIILTCDIDLIISKQIKKTHLNDKKIPMWHRDNLIIQLRSATIESAHLKDHSNILNYCDIPKTK